MNDAAVLLKSLKDKLPDFHKQSKQQESLREAYMDLLEGKLANGNSREEIEALLEEAVKGLRNQEYGALPTEEYDTHGLVVDWPDWPSTKERVLEFCKEHSNKHPVAFVDGSEIRTNPQHNFNWGVVNRHGIHYVPGSPAVHSDDAVFLSPEDLAPFSTPINPDYVVSYQRWRLEMQFLMDCMLKHPGTMCFLDGTLVNSFAVHMGDDIRAKYDELMVQVLQVSKDTKSPIVGFIDTSKSRDLTYMLGLLSDTGAPKGVYQDTQLLNHYVKHPGQRTISYYCRRNDGSLANYNGHEVCFTYAKTAPGNLSRIEYPAWVIDEPGLVDEIVRHLLMQSFAFQGYPRSFDECHTACTITGKERDQFTRTVERVLNQEGIDLTLSRKQASKMLTRSRI